MNMHATIEESVSKQRIGKHNDSGIVRNCVFCGGRPEYLRQLRDELKHSLDAAVEDDAGETT
jgi:hypothetical protein